MQLPNDEIGISDILQYLDCPARFLFGLRRRLGGEAPESWSPQNAYGSAIHLAIKLLDEGATEEEAVQAAVNEFGYWLEPTDVDMLYNDLFTYVSRDEIGVRTYMSEQDCRIPLFDYNGRTIYFRFTIDRLYQRLDDETKFVLVDYKSSKWIKSEQEVDEDKQLWAYNFGVHELIPEMGDLWQNYDQLRGGVVSTRKSEAQRQSMKRWLIHQITRIIEDETLGPHFNQWCPWCPLKFDCPVVRDELTDWARTRIAALAPREPKLKKDGSPSKVLAPPKFDRERVAEYVGYLAEVKTARKVLEEYESGVTDLLKELPAGRLPELGYERQHRTRRAFTPGGLRDAHELLGPEFYHVAALSQAAVDRHFGKGDERAEALRDLLEPSGGYDVVVPTRESTQDAA